MMASMGQADDAPFDLTILFFDDAFQWCEYLFDLFQTYDLTQNSERLNDFPTNEVTLSNIRRSLVQLVIISPQCVESCSTMIEQVTMSTIGLVCGTTEEDIEALYMRIPSSQHWKLVDTTPKTIINETLNMIKRDETYMEMTASKEEQPEDLYLDMEELTDQRDLYEHMQGNTSPGTGNFETDYEDMVPRSNQTVKFIPSSSRCGKSELVVLVFDDFHTIEGKDNFTVEFCRGNKKSVAPADKLNSYTLTVETPTDYPAGHVQAVVCSNNQTIAGSRFTFKSSMDVLADILTECVNPIEFLCDTMNISPGDHIHLDSYLSNLSKQVMETERFRDVFGVGVSKSEKSDKKYPTILHFAAKYGLSDLCVNMMNMPCVVQALNLTNCHGKTPPDLAEESGFTDLKAVLQSYQDNDLYGPVSPQGPDPYVQMDKNTKKSPYGNAATIEAEKMRYTKPFPVAIPAYKVEAVLQGTLEDVYGLYDTLPSTAIKAPPIPIQAVKEEQAPVESPSIQKKNEDNNENSLLHSNLDPGQLQLIDLQKRVARKEITVDEAVKIFEMFPKFTVAKPLGIDPQTLKNELKKKKAKKDTRKLKTRSQSSPMIIGSSNTLPNTATPVGTPKAKRSHSVNIISHPSITQALNEHIGIDSYFCIFQSLCIFLPHQTAIYSLDVIVFNFTVCFWKFLYF
ncbi:phosphoinositide 3-kinase adapter protein 1-like isoform X2 [Anneissia japonica]|uniref:phosphoinositide 3-kinase adapter protein 1-like isoform X2 n=1 Tax=Anneissia japonica TaxID=1529436 RepID=UPI0014256411|nr:phosphoinositide 3-kinase adapter protein 1-like isoform X2 [Anneissia japonica]